jgi:hypothetical protein
MIAISAERTTGENSARCGKQVANFLAITWPTTL